MIAEAAEARAVAGMVDFFLVLMIAGAGDEIQGIKKGLMELADAVAINKADGDNVERARVAAAEYRGALNILTPPSATWSPPVITYSALTGNGIEDLWRQVMAHKQKMTASGELEQRRREQQVKWMWTLLEERLTARLRSDPAVRTKLKQAEAAVAAGKLAPTLAVEEIAALLGILMHYLLTRAGSKRAAFLTGMFSQLVLLGTSYYPLDRERQSWGEWYATEPGDDFAAMSEMGISVVRVFFSWKGFFSLALSVLGLGVAGGLPLPEMMSRSARLSISENRAWKVR